MRKKFVGRRKKKKTWYLRELRQRRITGLGGSGEFLQVTMWAQGYRKERRESKSPGAASRGDPTRGSGDICPRGLTMN